MRSQEKAPKLQEYAQKILEAAYIGFAISVGTRTHRRVLMNEGLSGIKRVVTAQRRYDLLCKTRRLQQAKLVKMDKIGNRLQVKLTKKGRERLLKMRLKTAPQLPDHVMVLVAFDFPITQKRARNAFRHFLRSSGFTKMQQSLWTTRRDVVAPLQNLIASAGAKPWVKIFRAETA